MNRLKRTLVIGVKVVNIPLGGVFIVGNNQCADACRGFYMVELPV